MFVFRKYQSFQYHFQNVLRYLKEEEDNIIFRKDDGVIVKNPINVHGTIKLPANHYVYELSAFLEAMKSAIDFLATVVSLHLKGIKFDKISSLMKLVEKGRFLTIFDQIEPHFNWITKIREYRHHLVHRLIISISKEYKTLKVFDSSKTYKRPIVVPEKSPRYFPDTRLSRNHNRNSGERFGQLEIKTKFGNKSVITHFEYLPIMGYIPIEKFMVNQLGKFQHFFKDTINILSALDFKEL